jgi:hypothetical protein
MKTTKAMLIVSLCVLLPLAGQAGLVSTVNTDTLTNLDVDWTWNPEVASSDSPALLNWGVSVYTLSLDGSSWNIRLEVRHDAVPHIGESIPPLTTKSYSFPIAGGYGVVINDTFDIVHPGIGDIDRYTFVLNRDPIPANTALSLTGVHQVPEPGSMVLIGMSAGLLGFIRRRVG